MKTIYLTKLTNSTEIAKSMNKYFCNGGKKFGEKIVKLNKSTITIPVTNSMTIFSKLTDQV